MGETGKGLVAQRDISPDEIIAVFGNAIILQEAKMFNEFADLINVYNRDHPTQGFQYSILYPVAGNSHPSAVIPNQDRELALTTTISRQLRSVLVREKPKEALAHLANHTCCPAHRNAELQILSPDNIDMAGGLGERVLGWGGGDGGDSQRRGSQHQESRRNATGDQTHIARHAHPHLLQEHVFREHNFPVGTGA